MPLKLSVVTFCSETQDVYVRWDAKAIFKNIWVVNGTNILIQTEYMEKKLRALRHFVRTYWDLKWIASFSKALVLYNVDKMNMVFARELKKCRALLFACCARNRNAVVLWNRPLFYSMKTVKEDDGLKLCSELGNIRLHDMAKPIDEFLYCLKFIVSVSHEHAALNLPEGYVFMLALWV